MFAGHGHYYERFSALSDSRPDYERGTVHMTIGTGGGHLSELIIITSVPFFVPLSTLLFLLP